MVASPLPSAPSSVRLKSAVFRSDVGRARKSNEDGVLSLSKVPLYAVADGTGGPEPARVALTTLKDQAPQLVAKVADVLSNPSSASRLAIGRALEALFAHANAAVHEASEGIRERRIATTLCAATFVGPYGFIAHVGDSRAYLMRGGELRCLTNDHTLAAMQLRRGDITPAEFQTSPFRSTLSQALGMSPALEVDLLELRFLPGDTLLVTSNGLNRALSDELIAGCLASEGTTDERADLLIRKVHEAGAPDNTTFILVETEPPPKARPSSEDLERGVRRSLLFHDLSDTEWHQILSYLEVIEPLAGEVLCAEGEGPIGFGVVATGKVVSTQIGGETRELGVAEHFGAISLATENASLETVTAQAKTVLYVLSRARYQEIVRLNPVLGAKLTLALLESLGNRLGVLTTRLGRILDAANGKL